MLITTHMSFLTLGLRLKWLQEQGNKVRMNLNFFPNLLTTYSTYIDIILIFSFQ